MSGRYTLDDQGAPVMEPDLLVWGAWLVKADRRLALDKIDGVKVSTVFLGLDHSFGSGPPVLWETMIFGGKHDQYQERYTTRDAALAGHRHAVWLATN